MGFEGDFDFESSLAKFDEEKFAADLMGDSVEDGDELPSVSTGYQQSSFFDTISCEATDREGDRSSDHRANLKQQRKLDTETFGETAVQRSNRRNNRNGRRGR